MDMTALPQGDKWKEANEEDLAEIKECYCPNCGGGRATTVMLPTKVPFFREIYIMSLSCEECNFRNSEVNFGGEIQDRGDRITLSVTSLDDLNRQLIKSDSATLIIPSIEFEIPPSTQRGTISTIEGVLKRAAENLEMTQPERLRLGDVDNFHRCRVVIEKLRTMAGAAPEMGSSDEADNDAGGELDASSFERFELILDDPGGNSFIENPHAPAVDPHLKHHSYFRTPKQDMALGLQPSKEAVDAGTIDDADPTHKNVSNVPVGLHAVEIDAGAIKWKDGGSGIVPLGKQEVLKFPTSCPHCHKEAETDMCMTDIPHFKEVIIMCLLCEKCGYKSNEIKGGGAIPKFGTKITLKVESASDLAREVLKSDTAGVEIPELELELNEGGLDGLYTTVEGLLNKMHERLAKSHPFSSGDAARKQHLTNDGGDFSEMSPNYVRYAQFLDKLKNLANGKMLPFTLIISDPLSNSFVGPVPKVAVALALQAEEEDSRACYDKYIDPGMIMEEYERTNEQNEMLGLNDMKTEKYQQVEEEKTSYGTDQVEELPDRLRRLDHRGPDHPHQVGMPLVEGDTTVMGPKSANFAIPAMQQRGLRALKVPPLPKLSDNSLELVRRAEYDDENFVMNDEYVGPKGGMVFKCGAQGLGYYTDVPLDKLATCRNAISRPCP